MKNTERDYLKVAIMPIESQLLAEHWDRVAQSKVWIKTTGEEIPFDDLTNEHLGYIFQMLIRFNSETCTPALQAIVCEIYKRFIIDGLPERDENIPCEPKLRPRPRPWGFE